MRYNSDFLCSPDFSILSAIQQMLVHNFSKVTIAEGQFGTPFHLASTSSTKSPE